MGKSYFDRLEYLDFLIRTKSTGTPQHLAKKIGTSLRTVYDYLDLLKSLGAPIDYSKDRLTYYYAEEGHFEFHFKRLKQDNQ